MKILIAEDDVVSRRRLEAALASWGHEAVIACDGAQAWQALQKNDAPKLAILDWMMPRIDGLEVVRNLRQHHRALPTYVIILTAQDGSNDVVEALEAGADEYVTKPFNPLELRARIQVGVRVVQLQTILARRVFELESALNARKQAEEELIKESSLLHTLMDNLPDAIYFKNTSSRFTRINSAQAGRFGLSDPELAVGKTDFDFFTPEHAQPAFADEQEIIRTGRPLIGKEEKETWPDGREAWVITTKMPLRDPNGSVVGTFGVSRDITERKLAEEKNRILASIVESSDDAIFGETLDGTIISWNRGAEALYGYKAAEIRGRPVSLLIPPDRSDELAQILEELKQGEPVSHFETEQVTKEGTRIEVSLTISPIKNEAGQVVGAAVVARDITERQQAERRLATQHAVTRVVAESATLSEAVPKILEAICQYLGWDLAALWEADEHTETLRCTELWRSSHAELKDFEDACRETSFRAGIGLPGRVWKNREPAWVADVTEDANFPRASAARGRLHGACAFPILIAQAMTGVMEFFSRNVRQPDEKQTGLLSGIASQIGQLIERKRAEEALQKSEERARLLFGTIPHPVWVFDGETLEFLEVNDAAVAHYGYSRDEFLHMKVTDIHPREEVDRLMRDLKAPREALLSPSQWKHRTKDGRMIDVEISSHILEFGSRAAVIITLQDVTERKRLEIELRHSQKLEAIGGLAAGIAHEINTPIQFVGDNTRFLQDSFPGLRKLLAKYKELGAAAEAGGVAPELIKEVKRTEDAADLDYLVEEIPKALSQTLDGVDRVATIVRAMKDFAHPDRSEKAAADLNKALESTLIVARNEIKYVADIETDLGDLPAVVCHLGDLNQVFLNLLVNAAHAVGDAVKNTEGKGQIRVQTRREGDQVKIAISDTGGGIPENIRDRIFDPFFTTKEVGRGTGQGLAIARSVVVEKHGGTLTFETEVGRGTTFFVSLPIDGSMGAVLVKP